VKELLFLKGFLKNWREVGSPVPSSRHVARKICALMDFKIARRIVEVGPGTGVITREILECLHPDAKLIVFEVNKEFCDELRAYKDSRLVVHNVSAFQMHTVLPAKADYVVSGIPVATLSKLDFCRLHAEIRQILDPDGVFMQLQLAPVSYIRLKRLFTEVKVDFTLRNAPPAFMYSCRKPRRWISAVPDAA
jgi:phospholipid N-methyltransferase